MKRLKSGRFILSIISCGLLCSCVVTKAEGEQMMSDISRLKNEISTLQREKSDFTIIVDKRHDKLSARVSALENATYRKATAETHENDQLRREVEQLRGQLEETQKNLETISDQPGAKASVEPESIPTNKKEHFNWCQEAFNDSNFETALIRIDSFVDKYKDDNQYGAQAYLLKGDSAVMLAKKAPTEAAKKEFYKKAATSYQDLLTRFPKSPRIPEGLFKVGETLEAMGFQKDAKIFFEEIKTKHSKSAFAKKASDKLKNLTKQKRK